jgi:hypothetical protein
MELTIISHSSLFYWWPVWAVGTLLGVLTLLEDTRQLSIKKEHAIILRDASGTVQQPDGKKLEFGVAGDKDKPPRDVVIVPTSSFVDTKGVALDDPLKLHMSSNKNYGVLFATVLLVVIVITNVPLRGGWSFAIIMFAVLMSVIFALAGWWETILDRLHYLDIRINAGGYFFISGVLFLMWIIALWIFDPRIYMTFSPGQFKVCTEIGGGEKVFPAEGMALEKQRSDLFRHWVLGMGSGDLIVKTTGAKLEHFDLHNVLFIGKKVKQIEELMKKKMVTVSGR